ncbi:TetR/AcrR family transcriptional regulator, partial [Mycobacteroides abscessus]
MTEDRITRTARRAAATYCAVVDAAEQLVLESGADALTLEAVAD